MNLKSTKQDIQWILDAFNKGQYAEMLQRAKIVENSTTSTIKAKARHFRGLALILLWQLEDALPILNSAATELATDADAWDHYGVALNRYGLKKEAQECYLKVLKLAPDRADTLINAAKNAFDMQHYSEAESYSKAAIALIPNSAKAYGNLGNAYRGQEKYTKAAEAYFKAIEIDPSYAEAYNNLGVILHLKGDLDRALLAVQKSVELDPSDDANLNNLAIFWKQKGNLDKAQYFSKKALQGIIDRKYKKNASPKEYMNVEVAHRALLAFRSAMSELKVSFFLAYGTLLGIIRDGDLLPHDKDMDIGLSNSIDRDWLISELCGRFGFSRSSLPLPSPEVDRWNISVVHKETGITIDLFFFIEDGKDLISGIHHLPVPLFWRFTGFQTRSIIYLGQEWEIPDLPERYLSEIYGPEWRTPDPYFDSLISGYNRNPEALDVAICFALNRLYERMDRGEWSKALGYCHQINRHREDAFLRYVEKWIEEKITKDEVM